MPMTANGARVRSLMRRRSKPARSMSVDGFLSPSNLLEERAVPHRAGTWALAVCALTLAAVVLAAQTPLTEAIAVTGLVRTTELTQTVALSEGGTIAELLARDGSSVKAGAPILRLDSTAMLEERDALILQRRALAIEDERLMALLEGRAPEFDHIAVESSADVSMQSALFTAQIAASEGRRAVLESRISVALLEVASYRRLLEDARRRSEAAAAERSVHNSLTVNVIAPTAETMDVDARIDGAQADMAAHRGEIRRLTAAIDRARTELAAFERARHAEFRAQRTATLQAAETLAERISSLTERAERALVLAPVEGVIFFHEAIVAGATIAQGAEVGQILPAGADIFVTVPDSSGANGNRLAERVAMAGIARKDASEAAGHEARFVAAGQNRGTAVELNATLTPREEELQLRPGQVLSVEILRANGSLLEHLFRPVMAMTMRPS